MKNLIFDKQLVIYVKSTNKKDKRNIFATQWSGVRNENCHYLKEKIKLNLHDQCLLECLRFEERDLSNFGGWKVYLFQSEALGGGLAGCSIVVEIQCLKLLHQRLRKQMLESGFEFRSYLAVITLASLLYL